MSNLAPAELVAFLAVVEYGGFRAAARVVGSSPSALSHSVAGLEARLKVQLFIRTTRNVSLTEAGERFTEALQPALGQIGRAFDALGGDSGRPAGTLRVNASAGAAEQILEPILIEFLRQYPDMRLDIRADDAVIDIASGGFDCGCGRWNSCQKTWWPFRSAPSSNILSLLRPYIWKTRRIFPPRPICMLMNAFSSVCPVPRDTGGNLSAGEKPSALPPKGGWCLTARALFWVPRAPGLAWATSHGHWLLVIWRREALSSFWRTGPRPIPVWQSIIPGTGI